MDNDLKKEFWFVAVAMAFIQFGWGNYFCCMCDVAIAALAIYYILKQHNPNSERR